MKWLLTVALLCASVAHAQVVKLDAGDSSLQDSTGGSATVYLPNQTLFTSFGFLNGHFRTSLSDQFQFHKWDVTVGDKLFTFQSGSAAIGLGARGISFARDTKKQHVEFFVGAVGNYFSTPFFSGFGPQQIGSGISYHRIFQHIKIESLAAVTGHHYTTAGALTYHTTSIRLQGTAGYLSSSTYLDGTARWQPLHWIAFSGGHNYFNHRNLDTAGIAFGSSNLTFFGSAFHQQGTISNAAGATLRLGPLSFQEMWARTPGQPQILLHTVSENLRHFYFAQSMTQSGGRNNFAAGGGYHSNLFSISIDHTIFYDVAAGSVQQATSISFTFHIPHTDATINWNGHIDAGRVRYETSGEEYVGKMLEGISSQPQARSGGKYIVRLLVVDEHGTPVEGAVVYIGKDICITDPQGTCFVRERRARELALRVACEQFLVPGRWATVFPFSVARPQPEALAKPLVVTVRRVP